LFYKENPHQPDGDFCFILSVIRGISMKFNRKQHFTGLLFFLTSLLPAISFAQHTRDSSVFHRFADSTRLMRLTTDGYYIAGGYQQLPSSFIVVRELDKHTAIVRWKPTADKEVIPSGRISIAPALDAWKLSASLAHSKNKLRGQYIVSGLNYRRLTDQLTGIVPIMYRDPLSKSICISSSWDFIQKNILPDQNIIFIDKRFPAINEVAIIGYDRSFHGINAIDYSIPSANGNNIVAGVKEQKMEAQDLDLYKRVLPSGIEAPATEMHATVISTIIGGAGNSFYDGRGVAYRCHFFPSSFNNLFADDRNILNANNVTVQNHSYGTIVQQFYGAEALSYDLAGWLDKHRIHVFSAGNRGLQAPAEGPYSGIAGFANLTGNFKMAKNIIAVASVDKRENIINESSSGPTYDGRLQPQLTALGPNGTSDAAAMVSGAIAVLQQVFKDSNINQAASSALIKSILFNTATDIGRPGIDFKTGYGLLNTLEAVQQLQQRNYLESSVANAAEWTSSMTIPAGIGSIKFTLCWTDSAATLNNLKALGNDLDLSVQDPTGNNLLPWTLDSRPHPDSLAKLPLRARDSLNTVEQLSISLPPAGNYTVKVRGQRVANGVIPFSISYKLDTLNRFVFTSPQHSADINRQEDTEAYIRWKAVVADTNTTGNLFVSYNRGQDWQLIQSNYKIYLNKFLWTIKDTASTAQFRMQTGFGDFFSREIFIGKVTRLQVDFFCTDSFRISWPTHPYANGYKIFTLTDSPYLKHILTVTDRFLVLPSNLYPSNVFAVEPILNNGIPASRSIAIDIRQQGVKCFYKTFYHVLENENRLRLNLELSAPDYADSIYFEQVSSNGSLMRKVGSSLVIVNQNLYQQLVDSIPPGTSYWRAKILLRSGSIIYTDIIEVLSTGTQFLTVYPNPARREQGVQFIVKQGYASGARLDLYDATGRLLRSYPELPTIIDVSGFSRGPVFYKLIANGKILETGRFLIL
jgi:hypothetical protein